MSMKQMSQKNYLENTALEQSKTYTLPELAKKFNINYWRIYRWLERGHIEGEQDEKGQWHILETELPTFERRLKGWELLFGGDKK